MSVFGLSHYNHGKITLLPITFDPKVIDESAIGNKVFGAPVSWPQIEWYPILPTLTWSDLWPEIEREVKFWNWRLAKLGITRFVSSRREKHDGIKFENTWGWKGSVWPQYTSISSAWTVDLRSNLKSRPDSPFHCAPTAFCGLKLSFLVWVLCQLKQSPARLTKNGEIFALMTSFDLENVDPRSRNLHQQKFLCGPPWVSCC